MSITGDADNLWFLNFLTCRKKLPKLARLRRSSLLSLHGVGKTYAARIQEWQQQAQFAPDVDWVGDMIMQDAHRTLALGNEIKMIEHKIAALAANSVLAQTIVNIPGFGKTSMSEIAG